MRKEGCTLKGLLAALGTMSSFSPLSVVFLSFHLRVMTFTGLHPLILKPLSGAVCVCVFTYSDGLTGVCLCVVAPLWVSDLTGDRAALLALSVSQESSLFLTHHTHTLTLSFPKEHVSDV